MLILLMAFNALAGLSDVKPGMTETQVVSHMGQPTGKSPWFGGGSIWVYGKSGILINAGKVVKIEEDVAAEQKKMDEEMAKLLGSL